jgi:4-hydroxy-tetrahydrodipicolinate reductase
MATAKKKAPLKAKTNTKARTVSSPKPLAPLSKTRKQEVLLHGADGRMGLELSELLKNHSALKLGASVGLSEIRAFDDGHTAVLKSTPQALSAVVQGADIIIDFSSPAGTSALIKSLSASSEKVVLIGTTGLSEKLKIDIKAVAKKGQHKILLAGNTSLGAATLAKLAIIAARALGAEGFDIEVTETHHRMKADSPSGTALFLAEMIQRTVSGSKIVFNGTGKRAPGTIGIHSVRGGGVIGEHDIRFISDAEELCLSHRALNRSLFARGALNLALELGSKLKPGSATELRDFVLEN